MLCSEQSTLESIAARRCQEHRPSAPLTGMRTASAGVTSLSAACSGGRQRPRTARRHRATPHPPASPGSAKRSRPPDLPRGRLSIGAGGPTRRWHSHGGPAPARHCHTPPARYDASPSLVLLLCSSALGIGAFAIPVARGSCRAPPMRQRTTAHWLRPSVPRTAYTPTHQRSPTSVGLSIQAQ